MDSIQIDHVLRPPGLEGSTPRAATPEDTESSATKPTPDDRGPKPADSTQEARARSSEPIGNAQSADPGGKKEQARLREAADALAENVQGLNAHTLEIRYNEENSRFVVKILDAETGEVIREVPPERLLEAAARIDEIQGLIFDEKS